MRMLIFGIVALSAADLLLTLGHLRTIGMREANPVAAWLISASPSLWPLVVYKAATLFVCVSLLFALRRRWQGEAAAWVCLLILTALTVHWQRYSKHMDETHVLQAIASGAMDEDWLTIED